MTKDLKNDSAEYSSLILKELTQDWEKNVLMLQELRNKNRENGNLVRELDRLLLVFLGANEREEFERRLYYEILESHREGMLIVSRGLHKVVPEEKIPDIQLEKSPGTYGKDWIRLVHTDRQVILALDNRDSEFLNFAVDYFRGEPHGTEVLEEQAETIYVYRWDKEGMERFRQVPDEIDYLFTFGSALMGHGLYSYAIFRFREILSQDPDDHETLLRLSRCHIAMGVPEAAFQHLRKAASIKPNDESAYLELANCYKELGLYGMALENLLRVRDLGQGERMIHNNIGVAYGVLEEYSQAVEAYEKALEAGPEDAFIWKNIGLAYRQAGKWDRAIGAFEKYSELDPENHEPHILLGEVYEAMGDLSRATEAYQRALQIRPDYSAYLSLGRAYKKVNRTPDARKCYEEALKIYPHGKEPRAQLFRLDHPDMEELAEEMAQVVKDHSFLDDPDAVPVIYEEAKRRKLERKAEETAPNGGREKAGLN